MKVIMKVGDLVRLTSLGTREHTMLGYVAKKDAYDHCWVQWFAEESRHSQTRIDTLEETGGWKVEVAREGRWLRWRAKNEIS